MPGLAFAETGDFDNPVQLSAVPWSQDVTGSLLATTASDPERVDKCIYSYRVPLTRGQTVALTSTFSTPTMHVMMMFAPFPAPGYCISDWVSDTCERLTFMAPQSGNYYLAVIGSTVQTYTISAAAVLPVAYRLTSFTVPKSKKKGAKFTVSVKVNPNYDSVFPPVKFEVQRKLRGKWRPYSIVKGKFAGVPETWWGETKISAATKLGKKGTYRVRAVFSDVAHTRAVRTSYKTIKIK
jgi:hypothetical protein